MRTVTLRSGLSVVGMSRPEAEVLEFQTLDYFRHGIAVAPGDTVVDVGANFGLFALAVLSRTGGDCRVVCVEPSPAVAETLACNLARNYPAAAVHVVPRALAAVPGVATFYCRPAAPMLSSLSADYLDNKVDLAAVARGDDYRASPYGRYLPAWLVRLAPGLLQRLIDRETRRRHARVTPSEVVVTTLDRLFDESGLTAVDLLKIDTEGTELDVLDGLSAAYAGRVRQLVVEVHDIDGRVAAVRDRLTAWGFDEVAVDQELIFRGSNIYNVYARRVRG